VSVTNWSWCWMERLLLRVRRSLSLGHVSVTNW